ncbi:MAG: ImmA/IrrE family metallo-endopeptidase [Oscillospiraceae bacterium]|nr:ImmA/IrrE family metallo-endopeptidase [Oscillospiraceae bacterium]
MGNYRDNVLETIARLVIKEYNPELLTCPTAIPIEDIIERQYGLVIDYQYIRNNGRILGETVFDDTWIPVYDKENSRYMWIEVKGGTIIADASLLNNRSDGRLRFTLAHELSHWLIHQNIYAGSGMPAAMTKNAVKSSDEGATIERQADTLSSFLLMPAGQVKMAFHRARPTADSAAALADMFGVSKQAMQIRLKEMRLV